MPEPPADDKSLEVLRAYLAEHGARYSLESMKEHLLAEGYDPALIDRAVAEHSAGRAPEPRAAWPIGLAVGIGNLLLVPVFGLGLLLPLFELGFWAALRGTARDHLARSLLFGALFSLAVLALLFGVCLTAVFTNGFQW